MKSLFFQVLICLIALTVLISITGCETEQPIQGIGGGEGQIKEPTPCICIQVYSPVCGADGKTYSNSCFADCAKVSWINGECTASSPQTQ